MRFMPIQLPFSKPYFSIACRVYSEQEGVYRHVGGIHLVER